MKNDDNNNSNIAIELKNIDHNETNDDSIKSIFKNNGDNDDNNGHIELSTAEVPLEILEDEIWKEHLALQRLGLV